MSTETSPILPAKWDGRTTFSVSEAAEILGISRWAGYQAVKRGQEGKTGALPVIQLGARRLVVPRVALERMLSG